MRYCDMCGKPIVKEGRYIDEIYGTLCPDCYEEYGNEHLDVQEIIHCKDCKYYSRNNEIIGNVCKRTHTIFPMKENDFCSYGEKPKSDNVIEKVYCKDCQFLETESGGYACCGKAIKGIVKPWDFCNKGIKK